MLADHARPTDFLGDIILTFFEIRDLVNAGNVAQVQTEYTDWLQYALSFKTGGALTRANVAFETALANWVAAQTPETARALHDALNIVEQIFVGQYWGTPELVEYYQQNQ